MFFFDRDANDAKDDVSDDDTIHGKILRVRKKANEASRQKTTPARKAKDVGNFQKLLLSFFIFS